MGVVDEVLYRGGLCGNVNEPGAKYFTQSGKVELINDKPDSQSSYEMVNHPQHYNNYSMEVIDMMEMIWGSEATALWCEMTAFKYRMRMGTKPGDNSIQQDLKKEEWYLNKAKELRTF